VRAVSFGRVGTVETDVSDGETTVVRVVVR
jgi:hypothetical protein